MRGEAPTASCNKVKAQMTIITRAKTHTYSNRNKKSIKKYRIKSKKGVSTYITYIFTLSENKDVRQTKHTKVPVAPVIVSTRRRLEHSHFIQPEKMIIYKYRTQKIWIRNTMHRRQLFVIIHRDLKIGIFMLLNLCMD